MKKLTIGWVLGLFCMIIGCTDEDSFFFENSDVSKAGSTAKFHIYGDVLYVIYDRSLNVFDISDNELKESQSRFSINRDVETIFRYNDILFLGTTTGVVFMNVTNPFNPQIISDYAHLTSCDPVVSNGLFAYSTLRVGNGCGIGTNALDIIDIRDISNPTRINTITMNSPYGVGLLGNNLFVGEGANGMRWFDVTDPLNVIEVGSYNNITAKDFIIDGDVIIANTLAGITQMKISATNELIIISQLKYE